MSATDPPEPVLPGSGAIGGEVPTVPHPVSTLAPAALLAVVLAACSSSSGSGRAADPPSSAPPATSSAPSPVVAPPAAGSTAASVPASSVAASSVAAASSKAAAGAGITFTGTISGRMTVTACAGGIAQLAVDVDGEDSTYTGVIDATDFAITGPDSTGYTLAHGTAAPRVGEGGTTFTVHGTKLIGITNTDTLTATGSVTCP